MSNLNCQINIPEVSGLNANEITVGRHFLIHCQGQWDKAFDFSKAQLVLGPKEQYILKLFKSEARDTQSFDLDVTTYVAGKIDIPNLEMSDGQHQMQIGQIQFEVQSVLPKPEPQKQGQAQQLEQPKPYGYVFGQIQWPLLYTLIALGFVFVGVIYLIWKAMRRQKLKNLQTHVRSYESAQEPEQQFYKTLRQIEKKEYPLDDLIKACRVYILRQYQLPVFDLSITDCDRILKRQFVRFSDHRKIVINMLKDIEHLSKKTDVSIDQKNKFIKNFYDFVEKCESLPQDSFERGREEDLL